MFGHYISIMRLRIHGIRANLNETHFVLAKSPLFLSVNARNNKLQRAPRLAKAECEMGKITESNYFLIENTYGTRRRRDRSESVCDSSREYYTMK